MTTPQQMALSFSSISFEYPNADLLLAGDFNARTKDYMDCIVEDEADYTF